MGKIQTNADYIRSMSDEELAAYILNFKNTYGEEYEGESSFLEWLQEEKGNTGRLTVRSENSGMVWFKDTENNDMWCEPCEMSVHNVRMALAKLADYEDAEEQGLILRLPCKVGDKVYQISENFIEPCTVETIYLGNYRDRNGNWCNMAEIYYDRDDCPYVSTEMYFTDIGETVFLTETEAEAKLKGVEEKESKDVSAWKNHIMNRFMREE